MNKSLLIGVMTLTGCLCSALCQNSTKLHSRKPPDLDVKVISAQKRHGLHERLNARCELTNLTDETLCFPPPTVCSFSLSATRANPEETNVGDGIGSGCGGNGPSIAGNLLSEVRERWVKLPPNQTHAAECLTEIEFPRAGTWTVSAHYHPLKLAPDDKTKLSQSEGCRLPERVLLSPIKIEVVDEQGR